MPKFEFKGVEIGGSADLGEGFEEVRIGLPKNFVGGAYTAVELEKGCYPKSFRLKASLKKTGTFSVFNIFNKQIELPNNLGEVVLVVPVIWRLGQAIVDPVYFGYTGKLIPETRQAGKDNTDLLLVEQNGRFWNIQIGIVSRGGKFFITAQDMYCGWVGVKGFIPMEMIHNYPQSLYERMNPSVALRMNDIARGLGINPLKTSEPPTTAKWNPPPLPKRNDGKIYGVVYWFNLVIGGGVIADANGNLYFVHFSDILSEKNGQMQILEPMTRVSFFSEKGQRGLIAVKVAVE